MTVAITPRLITSTVLPCSVPVYHRYPATGPVFTDKRVKDYVLISQGQRVVINEGKFKRLVRQHNARNRFKTAIKSGFCTINL